MKNTINTIAALTNYGFEIRPGHLFAGRGSWLAGGETIKVFADGDMITVSHHKWLWNCDGDCEYDCTTTVRCHLSRVWESLPEWVLKR